MKKRILAMMVMVIVVLPVFAMAEEILYSDDFQSYSGTNWKSSEGGPWNTGGGGSYASLQSLDTNQFLRVKNGSSSGQNSYITSVQTFDLTQISGSESVNFSADLLGGEYSTTGNYFRMEILGNGTNFYGSTDCIVIRAKRDWFTLAIKKAGSTGWNFTETLLAGNASLSAGVLSSLQLELTATDYVLRVPEAANLYGVAAPDKIEDGWKIWTGAHNLNYSEFNDARIGFGTRNVTSGSTMTIDVDNVVLQTIPEPATVAMIAIGGFAGLIRKRK